MQTILANRQFWLAVWGLVLAAVAHSPAAQQIITGALTSLGRWATRHAPGWAFAIVKSEAETAVRAAYQRGQAYNWNGQQKLDGAVAFIQGVLRSHGVSDKRMPDTRAIEAELEATWNIIKPLVNRVTPAAQPEDAAPNPIAALIGVASQANVSALTGSVTITPEPVAVSGNPVEALPVA